MIGTQTTEWSEAGEEREDIPTRDTSGIVQLAANDAITWFNVQRMPRTISCWNFTVR